MSCSILLDIADACWKYVGGYNGYCESPDGTNLMDKWKMAPQLGQQNHARNEAGRNAAKEYCNSRPDCLGFGTHYSVDRYYIVSDTVKSLKCHNVAGNNCGTGTPTSGCYVKFRCTSSTPYDPSGTDQLFSQPMRQVFSLFSLPFIIVNIPRYTSK